MDDHPPLPDATVIDLDPIDPRDIVSARIDADIVPPDPTLRDSHTLHIVQASSEEEARAIVAARLGLAKLPLGTKVMSRNGPGPGHYGGFVMSRDAYLDAASHALEHKGE